MLGAAWNKNHENIVEKIEEDNVASLLSAGKSVIIDNTHFNPKHEEKYRKLGEKFGAEFEVKLFDVPLNTALIRNAGRPNPVPEKAIRWMYNQYVRPMREKKWYGGFGNCSRNGRFLWATSKKNISKTVG